MAGILDEVVLRRRVQWEHLGKLESPEYFTREVKGWLEYAACKPWCFRDALEDRSTFPQNPLQMSSPKKTAQVVIDLLDAKMQTEFPLKMILCLIAR